MREEDRVLSELDNRFLATAVCFDESSGWLLDATELMHGWFRVAGSRVLLMLLSDPHGLCVVWRRAAMAAHASFLGFTFHVQTLAGVDPQYLH